MGISSPFGLRCASSSRGAVARLVFQSSDLISPYTRFFKRFYGMFIAP